MKISIIVKKLHLLKKKLITREELKKYCNMAGMNYTFIIRNLLYRKYLIRIFKGIFYVKSVEERKYGGTDMLYYEIIANALTMKGVKNWYLGLETALKLNGLTHEYFNRDYIINDTIFRAKPMKIMGKMIHFIKLKPSLFVFGIKKGKLPYSDPEKTVLDMLYLRRYRTLGHDPIEVFDECSPKKLVKYAKHYNKALVRETNERINTTYK